MIAVDLARQGRRRSCGRSTFPVAALDYDRLAAIAEGEFARAASRLVIRFGPGHSVVSAFAACEEALDDWLSADVAQMDDDVIERLKAQGVASQADDPRSAADRRDASFVAFVEGAAEFRVVAAKTAGVRLA